MNSRMPLKMIGGGQRAFVESEDGPKNIHHNCKIQSELWPIIIFKEM